MASIKNDELCCVCESKTKGKHCVRCGEPVCNSCISNYGQCPDCQEDDDAQQREKEDQE